MGDLRGEINHGFVFSYRSFLKWIMRVLILWLVQTFSRSASVVVLYSYTYLLLLAAFAVQALVIYFFMVEQ